MKTHSAILGLLVSGGLLVGLCDPLLAQSTDTIRPLAIVSTSPEESTSGIDVNTPVSITFAEDIDPSTLTPDNFYLYSMDNLAEFTIPGKIRYDAESRTVYFIPDGDLSYSTNYVVTVEGGVKTISGRTLDSGYSWRFTTRNSTGGCGGS